MPVVEGLKVEPWDFGDVSKGVDGGDREVDVFEGEG